MNPRMLVEFVDGSKTMVEMATIANATGLLIDKPGMHGPMATLETLADVFRPVSEGGILTRKGVVDFTLGKGVAPGVFVVVELDHPRLCERMHDLKMGGEGPYYSFYRPHHLTSLEVPLSAARAVIHGAADMVPLDRPIVEVCALAKRDLKPGDRLDAIGETCYRSYAVMAEEARALRAWPVGLLDKGVVTAPIAKDSLITRDAVEIDRDTTLARLRRDMEISLWGATA